MSAAAIFVVGLAAAAESECRVVPVASVPRRARRAVAKFHGALTMHSCVPGSKFGASRSLGRERPTRPNGDATGRAHHRAFDALGPLDAAPAGCDLVNIPELVAGPKKGDDDKRACKGWLDALAAEDAGGPCDISIADPPDTD